MGQIGGYSIIKLFGVFFFICSLFAIDEYYAKRTTELYYLLAYTVIGTCVDIIRQPFWSASDFNEITRQLLIFIFIYATYNVICNHGSRIIINLIAIGGVILAFMQFVDFGFNRVIYEQIGREEFQRVSALGRNANETAMFISLAVIMACYYLVGTIKSNFKYRLLSLVIIGVGVLGIIKTSSRGGLLTLVVGTLSMIVVAKDWSKKMFYGVLISVSLLIMFFVVINDPLLSSRIFKSMEEGDTAGRMYIWERGIELFYDKPIVGFGHSRYIADLGWVCNEPLRAGHNTFLSVLLGSGFAGLIFFMIFYIKCFANIWKNKYYSINKVIFSWFVMGIVASMSCDLQTTKWFVVCCALALASPHTASRVIGNNQYNRARPSKNMF